MKDIIKPVRMPIVRVKDRIHGHTRFDLFDVNTKRYKRVESDNIVTDAVEEFLKSYGAWGMSPFYPATYYQGRDYSNNPGYTINSLGYLKYLFGGLMLFDSEIPTTNLFMPAGVKMTANGAMGNSNSGNCPEFGSYNSGESSITDTTATMVYDFATNQGCGDIGCACLTSYHGGLIGYGNSNEGGYRYTQSVLSYSSGAYDYGSPLFLPRESSSGKYIYLWYNNTQYRMGGVNINFEVASGTTSITVDRKQFPVEEVTNPISTVGTYKLDSGFEDSFTFNFGALSGTYCPTIPYKDKVYLFPKDVTIAVGSTFRVVELDFTNETATDITITNSAPESIYTSQYNAFWYYGGFTRFAPFKMTDTEMVFIGASNGSWAGKLYIVDLTDSTAPWTDTGFTISRETAVAPWNAEGDLWLYMPSDDANKAYPLSLMDTVNKTILPLNAQMRYWGYSSGGETMRIPWMNYEHPFLRYVAETSSMNVGILKNPLYLATINNLDSPVTKTTAQTMKVTYTLTLGSGE